MITHGEDGCAPVAPDTALLDRADEREHAAALLAETNRHAEVLLAEQNRHREEMAFYRTLTAAGILAMVVLLLGMTLAYVTTRRRPSHALYIVPSDSVIPELPHPTRTIQPASFTPSSVLPARALLPAQTHHSKRS